MDRYLKASTDLGDIYVRGEDLNRLRIVDAVIFDCDGVLIDVRRSYHEAIRGTVSRILCEATGLGLPRDLISEDVIYLFKRSGGFNNDWDLTYSILIYLFFRLLAPTRAALIELANSKSFGTMDNLEERLKHFRDHIRQGSTLQDADQFIRDLEADLRSFARDADITGIGGIENWLGGEGFMGAFGAFNSLLRYPGPVGDSLITTVFEEVFCGQEIFRAHYGGEPRFHRGPGLIEKERKILSPGTLESLASILHGGRFGIASGRPLLLAMYTMGELLSQFVKEAMVFLDTVEEAEMRTGERLKKPHPFSLIKSADGLRPFEAALYVGDSMEDIIMTEKANTVLDRFSSAGVYRYSDLEDRVIRDFLEAGADLVLPSVNELPMVLESIKEGRICG